MENTGTTALLERCLSVPDGLPLPQADADALRLLMEAMPSATILPLLLLRHGAARSDEETAALQERLALMCADRRTLAFAAHGEAWADFYPADDEPEAKQTVDVIDTFLRTYGTVTPEEERMLERMIFNPTPDYAEMLAREEQENLPAESSDDTADADDPQAARINAFIRSQHPAAHRSDPMPDPTPEEKEEEQAKAHIPRPEHADDSLLSESLAKIFIKQGRYERAYEIISGLNLKFPKKSAYFADQLRFLQKLIINKRHIDGQSAGGATEK